MTLISRVAIAAIAATVCLAGVALADDDDYPSWRPNGKTAASITGPVILLPTKLRAANTDIPLRRDIEIAGFRAGQGDIPARLYAVTATTNPTLLNGNKLCSAQPTWIVVVPLPPEGLQIDAFSSTEKPANESSPGLCGTFNYMR